MAVRDAGAQRSDLDDAYLPLKALAAYSGLSVRTLRVHLLDPIRPMPHYRVRGKILIRRREFDGWVQQFRVTSVPTGIDAIVNDVVANLR